MEIKKFEEEFYKLREEEREKELKISIISEEDIKNPDETKVVIDGKEIQDKVIYLICVEELNVMGVDNGRKSNT